MKGSPAKLGTISGTAGHASALKQVAGIPWITKSIADLKAKSMTDKAKEKTDSDKEKKDSPEEKKVWIKKGGSMKHKMKDLKAGSKERYEEYERRGWKHDETTKGYKPSAIDDQDYGPDHKDPGYAKFMEKHADIADKADRKKEKQKAKYKKKDAEVTETTRKKLSKLTMKTQKKTHGKGSMKHQQAKLAYLKDKEADRQGTEGGKKQGLFRKWASKINLKRQEKAKAKIKAMEDKA